MSDGFYLFLAGLLIGVTLTLLILDVVRYKL